MLAARPSMGKTAFALNIAEHVTVSEGLPALVFPIASDERGLPISVQAVARPHEDATLLAWAASHEQRLYGAHGIPTPHPSTV